MIQQTIHNWESPKQRGRNKKKETTQSCPCCNGTGKRRDRKTLLERDCVASTNGQIKVNT